MHLICFVLFCLDTKKNEKRSRQKDASTLFPSRHLAFLPGLRAEVFELYYSLLYTHPSLLGAILSDKYWGLFNKWKFDNAWWRSRAQCMNEKSPDLKTDWLLNSGILRAHAKACPAQDWLYRLRFVAHSYSRASNPERVCTPNGKWSLIAEFIFWKMKWAKDLR